MSIITLPSELVHFQLPTALQNRLQTLLDHQDLGQPLTPDEQAEALGLVELAEFLSLLGMKCKSWG
ncbi:hypothetical protein [Spirulina major]|uniref:hypothetical protein n=1 Tax=Spirulina major TaxID=270636 RepID=UPI0009324244|nr:hypothetical protein [Spirulina major]